MPTILPFVRTSWLAVLVALVAGGSLQAEEMKVPVSFSGGHETDPQDRGRPVVLIAAALEVKPEVFREAFKGVTPARNGRPSPEDARKNKAALMKVLQPLGVTNDRLDEVSNYYRYRPQNGELWTNRPAKAHAIVEDGKVKKIVVTDAGAGYSSAPVVSVEGMKDVTLKVGIRFGKELKTNGEISAIEVAAKKP